MEAKRVLSVFGGMADRYNSILWALCLLVMGIPPYHLLRITYDIVAVFICDIALQLFYWFVDSGGLLFYTEEYNTEIFFT